MRPRTTTKARKTPRQARSGRTVGAILDAGAQVFVRRGYDGTTTARIAERAGVSVGSLYQYFPNKDAVLLALAERHVGESHATLGRALDELEARAAPTLDEIVRALVRALIEAHAASPALHRLLSDHVPRLSRLESAKDASDRALLARVAALIGRTPRARAVGATAAIALVAHTLESLAHWYVLDAPALGLEAPAFVDEVTALACGYLSREPDTLER